MCTAVSKNALSTMWSFRLKFDIFLPESLGNILVVTDVPRSDIEALYIVRCLYV